MISDFQGQLKQAKTESTQVQAQIEDLKAKLSQRDKLVKSQQSDIENLSESLEKARGQL